MFKLFKLFTAASLALSIKEQQEISDLSPKYNSDTNQEGGATNQRDEVANQS